MTHKDLEQLAAQYYNAREKLFMLMNGMTTAGMSARTASTSL